MRVTLPSLLLLATGALSCRAPEPGTPASVLPSPPSTTDPASGTEQTSVAVFPPVDVSWALDRVPQLASLQSGSLADQLAQWLPPGADHVWAALGFEGRHECQKIPLDPGSSSAQAVFTGRLITSERIEGVNKYVEFRPLHIGERLVLGHPARDEYARDYSGEWKPMDGMRTGGSPAPALGALHSITPDIARFNAIPRKVRYLCEEEVRASACGEACPTYCDHALIVEDTHGAAAVRRKRARVQILGVAEPGKACSAQCPPPPSKNSPNDPDFAARLDAALTSTSWREPAAGHLPALYRTRDACLADKVAAAH